MEYITQRSGCRAQALIAQVLQGNTTQHPQVAPRTGEDPCEQALPTLFRERTEVTHHATMRGSSIRERENHAVPGETAGLIKCGHYERLGGVRGHEARQLTARLSSHRHCFVDSDRVLR